MDWISLATNSSIFVECLGKDLEKEEGTFFLCHPNLSPKALKVATSLSLSLYFSFLYSIQSLYDSLGPTQLPFFTDSNASQNPKPRHPLFFQNLAPQRFGYLWLGAPFLSLFGFHAPETLTTNPRSPNPSCLNPRAKTLLFSASFFPSSKP